jgi:hypothetical protein
MASAWHIQAAFGLSGINFEHQLRFDAAPWIAGISEHDRGLKMVMPPEMSSRVAGVVYAVLMVAVIVGMDFAFFRNRFWERLISNIGVVLVFAAFYLRFLKHP